MNRLLRALGLRKAPTFSVQATVIRADGTREELGTIAKGTMTMGPAAAAGEKED